MWNNVNGSIDLSIISFGSNGRQSSEVLVQYTGIEYLGVVTTNVPMTILSQSLTATTTVTITPTLTYAVGVWTMTLTVNSNLTSATNRITCNISSGNDVTITPL